MVCRMVQLFLHTPSAHSLCTQACHTSCAHTTTCFYLGVLAVVCFWPNGGNPECKHCTQFVVIDLVSQAVCCFWSCSLGSVAFIWVSF